MLAAAARKVVMTTIMASSLKASTLPGLKPNQPTHKSRIDSVSQPGLSAIGCLGLARWPRRRSSRQIWHRIPSPAAPAAPCTTRPPAKSTMPRFANHPVGFQIHAAGRFQITTKYTIAYHTNAEILTFRNTTRPTNASVTAANAVSNRKYVAGVRPVLKKPWRIDHHTSPVADTPAVENPPRKNP